MSVINSHDWKAFRLGDLFDIVRGTSRTIRMLNAGAIPIIAAARAEQGVAGHYDVLPEYADAITISCNGVGCGSVFYHDGQFAITGDASVMQEKQEMTREAKLFVAAICDSLFFAKYSYAEKCNPAGLAEEMISLPATPDGQPDWAYMDAYMSEVLKKEEVFAEHLASLTAEAVADGHKLDISGWKAFRLTDLFVMRNTKSIVQQSVVFDSGDVPYVTSQVVDNGVAGYISCSNAWLELGNCLLIGGKTSTVFYQALDFCSNDSHNIACYAKESISDKAYLFLQSILSDFLRQHYSWGNSLSMKSLVSDEIYLPVTSDDRPDWAWMEQYMQQQMDKAEALVEHLDAVWN